MFSKTGNTVDSQVNQAIHQGGVPGVGVHDPLTTQGVHGGHVLPGQGVTSHLPGQGVTSHLPGHGVSSHLPGQGLTSHLPGQGVSGLHGQNLHGINPTVTQDQTLGHSGLGTVQGFVGQGVSTGLGFHSNPVLPHPPVDPALHDTRHGHHGATTAGVVGAGGVAGAHHAHKVKTGRGTLTFRPIEARFNHDKDLLGKMDPYCKFKVGMHRGKSEVAKGQGVAPVWNDAVIVKHKNQEFAKLKVKDHDKLRIDDTIGTAKIPLDQVLLSRNVDLWVPVSKKDKVTGEVHLIIEYTPRDGGINTVETAAV